MGKNQLYPITKAKNVIIGDADNEKSLENSIGKPGGFATLDENGKLNSDQMPAGVGGGSDTHYAITEDMFDIEFDDTKGVAPYSVSYGYTNITLHDDTGVEWKEGAIYNFILNTKISTSANRNVRIRIGENGDWKPLMTSTSIANGYTVFIKSSVNIFIYKSTYQKNGALHCLYDTNTTYTINYLFDAGVAKSGVGDYAISRYALCMQKSDMTWEKIVDTTKAYTTAVTKKVNTNGFFLNRIVYYNTTANVSNGANVATNAFSIQSASFDARYSTNCGGTPDWTAGDYFYLVGTIGNDGLFYLDATTWWTTMLPTTDDGKLYIQIGRIITTASYTVSLFINHYIYYFKDGKIREYIVADNKQDKLTSDQLAALNNGLTTAEKNWVAAQAEAALKTEAATHLSIDTTDGQTFYSDTTAAANRNKTITVTLTWNENNKSQIVAADDTPANWFKGGNYYTYNLTDTVRTISATNFNYTIPSSNAKYGGITLTKASAQKSISVVNPAWIGLYESNDVANITAAVSAINSNGRKVSTVNESQTYTNTENKKKYLWIVTKGIASATQMGLSILGDVIMNKSFTSPNNSAITMSGYKVYISTGSIGLNEAFTNTQINITL